MVIEYRRQSTKEYKVNLVTKAMETTAYEICLKFKVFLNRANLDFYFLVSTLYVGKPDEEQLNFERYIPQPRSKFVSSWENVTLQLNPTMRCKKQSSSCFKLLCHKVLLGSTLP